MSIYANLLLLIFLALIAGIIVNTRNIILCLTSGLIFLIIAKLSGNIFFGALGLFFISPIFNGKKKLF